LLFVVGVVRPVMSSFAAFEARLTVPYQSNNGQSFNLIAGFDFMVALGHPSSSNENTNNPCHDFSAVVSFGPHFESLVVKLEEVVFDYVSSQLQERPTLRLPNGPNGSGALFLEKKITTDKKSFRVVIGVNNGGSDKVILECFSLFDVFRLATLLIQCYESGFPIDICSQALLNNFLQTLIAEKETDEEVDHFLKNIHKTTKLQVFEIAKSETQKLFKRLGTPQEITLFCRYLISYAQYFGSFIKLYKLTGHKIFVRRQENAQKKA
jgi:hypothetical protein